MNKKVYSGVEITHANKVEGITFYDPHSNSEVTTWPRSPKVLAFAKKAKDKVARVVTTDGIAVFITVQRALAGTLLKDLEETIERRNQARAGLDALRDIITEAKEEAEEVEGLLDQAQDQLG